MTLSSNPSTASSKIYRNYHRVCHSSQSIFLRNTSIASSRPENASTGWRVVDHAGRDTKSNWSGTTCPAYATISTLSSSSRMFIFCRVHEHLITTAIAARETVLSCVQQENAVSTARGGDRSRQLRFIHPAQNGPVASLICRRAFICRFFSRVVTSWLNFSTSPFIN